MARTGFRWLTDGARFEQELNASCGIDWLRSEHPGSDMDSQRQVQEMQTTDTQNATLIEDIRSRQSKYIGVSGLLTQRIDDLEGRIRDLEVEMAVLKAELAK